VTSCTVSATVPGRLRAAKGFVFDMDGTLVLADPNHQGATALPGAAEMLREIAARGLPFMVFTNGANRAPAALAGMLNKAGLPVAPAQVMTPSSTAAALIRQSGLRRVMMISSEAARAPLAEAGLEVVGSGAPAKVDAVYAAWDTGFNMEQLDNAARAIWDGAAFYSASMHPHFMTANGRALSICRAISASIISVTGKRPAITGKPSVFALCEAARRMGVAPSSLTVVGDDAALDVRMAVNGGALGVLMRTGVTGNTAIEAIPRPNRPDLALPDLHSLRQLWTGSL
jgi:4-nitrophenyl phosphatase